MSGGFEMAVVSFNKEQIDELTIKLGRFAKAQLDETEWELLLAIFAAAADKLVISQDDEYSVTLPGVQLEGDGEPVQNPKESEAAELREQIQLAYIPGRQPPGDIASITPIRKGP
jgi:hypothetical protein